MPLEKVQFCIGYIGMTLHYHTIYIVVPPKLINPNRPIPKKFDVVQPKEIMLSPRRKFFKVHKTKKVSTNYEGIGKNKK